MPTEKHLQDLFRVYEDLRSPHRLAADPESLTSQYGRFSVRLVEVGLGTTMGNLLRGALLSLLEGAAIAAVKIEGVDDESSSVPGVVEDATDILHNLQAIRFRLHTRGPKTLKISKDTPGEVTAGDVELDADVEILDPSVHIATIGEGGSLKLEMRLKHGRGYVPAGRNLNEDLEPGYIPIASVYTPVKIVNYKVEPTHFRGDACEKFWIDILTDGSVRPQDALRQAAHLISQYMSVFINFEEATNEYPLLSLAEPDRFLEYTDVDPDAAGRMHEIYRQYGSACDVQQVEDVFQTTLQRLVELKTDIDLVPTVREAVQEESTARNYVTKRYRSLIDRKYLSGLSASENEELDALSLTLEEMDKPYYEAIIGRLRNLINQNQS